MSQKAYHLYRCLLSHTTGKRYFQKGTLYSFASDPGARFELIGSLGDPRRPAPLPWIDEDGTYYPGVFGWDDMSFPFTAGKLGILNKPDYDYDENGLLFPQDDTSEVVYMNQISSHKLMIDPDSLWFPHIHFWQSSATLPVFEYRLRIVKAGATVGAWSDWTADVGSAEFDYTSGTIHQILHFPDFNAYDAGHTSPAVSLDVDVRRNDDVVTGDVLAKSFDIHVPLDAPLGSGQQFLK